MTLRLRLPVLLCLMFVAVSTSGCRQVSPGVTLKGILSLHPGMTYPEVVAAIGEPFKMEVEAPDHLWDTVSTQEGNHGHVLLTYTQPMIPLLTTYPMLWVHMQSGHVSEIYAKRYFALVWWPWRGDDEGIYGYYAGGKPWSNADVLAEMFPQ
jgi:hypothetical protein